MKLGFITNCFAWAGMNDFAAMARWAKDNGFSDLEIGPSIPLDEALFAEESGACPVESNTDGQPNCRDVARYVSTAKEAPKVLTVAVPQVT